MTEESRRLAARPRGRHPHEVHSEGTHGQEALDQIETQPPDVLLLDLLMPELDGLSVLEKLRGMGSTIPVIVVTADIQETTRIPKTAK